MHLRACGLGGAVARVGAVAAVWAVVAVGGSPFAAAQETAPYPNGTSGIKAETVPPPGYYWLMYNRMYQVEELKGPAGETLTANDGSPLGASIRGYANVHRFVHVTELEFAGANYSWNAVLPFVAIKNQIAGWQIEDSQCRIGDVNLEPLVLEWHQPQYEFGFLYGLTFIKPL